MTNIQSKTGNIAENSWKLADEEVFIKEDKTAATNAELLRWLKSEDGLSHVHANFAVAISAYKLTALNSAIK